MTNTRQHKCKYHKTLWTLGYMIWQPFSFEFLFPRTQNKIGKVFHNDRVSCEGAQNIKKKTFRLETKMDMKRVGISNRKDAPNIIKHTQCTLMCSRVS